MKLTVLGSGTGIPSLERSAPGYLLESDAGALFLLDCGAGTLLRLESVGRRFFEIDRLFISHVHPDHIGDLVPLMHALRLPGVKRDRPLTIHGPPGFSDFFARFIRPVTGIPKGFPLAIVEAPMALEDGLFLAQTAPTVHSDRIHSVAYRFEERGRVLFYSGDCDLDGEMIGLAQGADVAILDCSTLHRDKVEGHLSALECGQVAREAGVGLALLSHLYPIDGAETQRIAECGQRFSGRIELARDFLEISV